MARTWAPNLIFWLDNNILFTKFNNLIVRHGYMYLYWLVVCVCVWCFQMSSAFESVMSSVWLFFLKCSWWPVGKERWQTTNSRREAAARPVAHRSIVIYYANGVVLMIFFRCVCSSGRQLNSTNEIRSRHVERCVALQWSDQMCFWMFSNVRPGGGYWSLKPVEFSI